MPMTQNHAKKIAKKLGATIGEGRRHRKVEVKYQGKIVAWFNIRRSSHENRHDFIAGQLHVQYSDAMKLADCSMSKEDYFNVLHNKGILNEGA